MLWYPKTLSKATVIETTMQHHRNTYELVSCRKKEKKIGVPGRFKIRQTEVDFLYIAVSGPDMNNPRDIQKELEELCDFGSLGSKTLARLEHLQADVKVIETVDESSIELIKDAGHVGCGFFPSGRFGNGINTVMVRVVSPKKGLFKGILTAKPANEIKENHFQFPESMRKALPSKRHSQHLNDATLIRKSICAPSESNRKFGRFLDPNQEAPESFIEEKQKELSKMYKRILEGFGVPNRIVDDYRSRALYVHDLKHANLMGVADPTGHIPYGSIFIPGCKCTL